MQINSELADIALSTRERLVLNYTINFYITNAVPVSSNLLKSSIKEESLSGATIRNVLSALEEKGLITHPHTSAGRVPTDKGYRYFVNEFLSEEVLNESEIGIIDKYIDESKVQSNILKTASNLIGELSKQLGVVAPPELLNSILAKIDVIKLSDTRLFVLLSMKENFTKNFNIELNNSISNSLLEKVVSLLNEKLSGLTLAEIRRSCYQRLCSLSGFDENELVKYFLENSNIIFSKNLEIERLYLHSTTDTFLQPEFSDVENLKSVIELFNDEEKLSSILTLNHIGQLSQTTTNVEPDFSKTDKQISIVIGSESSDFKMKNYSIITTKYQIGEAVGTIGIIGPKRLNYPKMVAIIQYISRAISNQKFC